MKGKYINTVIMMAALSGKNHNKMEQANKVQAYISDDKTIWSKNVKPSIQTSTYRSITAMIH